MPVVVAAHELLRRSHVHRGLGDEVHRVAIARLAVVANSMIGEVEYRAGLDRRPSSRLVDRTWARGGGVRRICEDGGEECRKLHAEWLVVNGDGRSLRSADGDGCVGGTKLRGQRREATPLYVRGSSRSTIRDELPAPSFPWGPLRRTHRGRLKAELACQTAARGASNLRGPIRMRRIHSSWRYTPRRTVVGRD